MLAPVTSAPFVLWTWKTALWITLWKLRVAWTSLFESLFSGIESFKNLSNSKVNFSISTLQADSNLRASLLSKRQNNKCSVVTNEAAVEMVSGCFKHVLRML